MRRSFLAALARFAPLLVVACGDDVTSTEDQASSSTSSSTTATSGGGGASASSATTGAGGEAATTGAGGSPSTTASVTSSSSGAGGAGGSGGCDLLAPLLLSDGFILDDGMDGAWSPGEGAQVGFFMTNPTDEDIQYPGVTITSDHPGVTTGNPYNAFFVIFTGASETMSFGFTADASVAVGTQVTFTVTLTEIGATVCSELVALKIQATIA